MKMKDCKIFIIILLILLTITGGAVHLKKHMNSLICSVKTAEEIFSDGICGDTEIFLFDSDAECDGALHFYG